MPSPARLALTAVLAALAALTPATASGQTLAAPFDSSYSIADVGAPPGVPTRLGGLTLKAGTTDRLLIGEANVANGALYEVALTRDGSGHVNGFSGTATRFADAAFNDGGVTYGPGGVLFVARWPENGLGQTKPGSSITDKIIPLGAHSIAPSPGSVTFVPPGQPGAGSLKLASYDNGEWYDAEVVPDGSGTFDLQGVTQVTGSTLNRGPEGFVYVNSGSPQFAGPSMLVSEFDANEVGAYDVDVNGDPVIASRRTFITGLSGAEGALIDPVTGDFLFSTFGGGNRVIVVRGFASATLQVVKHVINDNGASAAAGAWTMHVRSGGADVAGSPFAGAEPPGVATSLPSGSYVVSESGGPSGYTASFSGDCDDTGLVTLQPGETKTCTLTSDDVPPPPPPPPPPEFVPEPPPPPDTFGNTVVGFWKVPGSRTSVVFHVYHVPLIGGQLPAPQWGWTPDKLGVIFRPAGCYTQVGRSAWVIGFGGGGAFRRYDPGTRCKRWRILTTRWFLNGPNGIYQNFLFGGRQRRLFWERVRPLLDLREPSYHHE